MSKSKYKKKMADDNQPKSNQAVSDCLEQTGNFCLKTPVEKQPKRLNSGDFAIQHKDGSMWLIDVERKATWEESGAWPLNKWPTIDVSSKKAGSRATLLAMINSKRDTIILIMMRDVISSPIYIKNKIYNKYNGEISISEEFFAIDLPKVPHTMFVLNSDGKWENRGKTA